MSKYQSADLNSIRHRWKNVEILVRKLGPKKIRHRSEITPATLVPRYNLAKPVSTMWPVPDGSETSVQLARLTIIRYYPYGREETTARNPQQQPVEHSQRETTGKAR